MILDSTSDDPSITFRQEADGQIAWITIEMDSPANTTGQVFWADDASGFTELDSYSFEVYGGSHRYDIPISASSFGTLRIAVGALPGEYSIGELTLHTMPLSVYGDAVAGHEDAFSLTYFSQNRLEGVIHTSKEQLLFFSIKNDPGWKVTIDGAERETITVDAGLMAVSIAPGDTDRTLTYTPPHMAAGGVISLVSLAVYLFIVFAAAKRKRG